MSSMHEYIIIIIIIIIISSAHGIWYLIRTRIDVQVQYVGTLGKTAKE